MLRWIVWTFRVAVALLLHASFVGAADPAPSPAAPAVRLVAAFNERWIGYGICRSSRFRELVTDLSGSDVIVYVEPRFLQTQAIAGGLQFVSVTPTARVLRAVINLRLIGANRDSAVAILGHELQHALEVAEAAEIRSTDSFNAYYARHATGTGISDTAAARDAERAVRSELFRWSGSGCATAPVLLAALDGPR